MSRFIDLTDKKFGRLSVIMRVNDDKSGNIMWKCKCDCGNERIVYGAGLKRGASTSCGCYRKEYLSKIKKKYNEYNLDGEYGIGYASNTNNSR